MKIVIAHYETEEPIVEIEDATSAQVSAYSNVECIQLQGDDWHIKGRVVSFEKNTLYIFVVLSNSWN